MNILLTGGSGFVGGAAACALAVQGHQLVLPLRTSLQPKAGLPGIRMDRISPLETMTVEDWLPVLAGVDAVVHSAAIAHIGPAISDSQYTEVNRDASHRLALAARQAGVQRFVFISSIRAQVGPTSPDVQDEATIPAPAEAYGRSKLEAEVLIRQVFPDAVVLRPSLVVGAEARGNLDLLVKLARSGMPVPLGSFVRPQAMVSLEGLVLAIGMALDRPNFLGETIVVADNPHPTLADMVGWIREGLGQPRRIFSLPEGLLALPLRAIGKGDAFTRMTRGLRIDASRLRSLGWQSPVTPQEAFTALGRAARR